MIGNSLGAQIIVDFAVRYPTQLSAAVLVGLTIDPEARRFSTQVYRLLKDIPREPPSLYWIALTDYVNAGLGRCLQTLRHALEYPIKNKLQWIQVPVLVVRGEYDPIVPQRWTEQASELIPQARWVTIAAAAHAVNFSAPEALAKEVLEFRGLAPVG
jgi:pimeloyl-ACP methyl ester carboxylesterase